MSNLKPMVLKIYKQLHRTRLRVFNGDIKALTAARIKINEEFKKNKHVTDEASIKTMLKLGEDVERELRTQVIQAKQVEPGVFEARITSDILKLDNTPYNDDAIPEGGVKKGGPCCQDKSQNT